VPCQGISHSLESGHPVCGGVFGCAFTAVHLTGYFAAFFEQ